MQLCSEGLGLTWDLMVVGDVNWVKIAARECFVRSVPAVRCSARQESIREIGASMQVALRALLRHPDPHLRLRGQ